MTTESLEQRLTRLEDIAGINQLLIDYGRYLDAGDFASYATLFAPDGEVKLGPMGRAKGPEEIRTLMEKALSHQVGTSYHIIGSPQFVVDGNHAASTAMWTVVQLQPDGTPATTMVGKHHDKLVKIDGQWKFLERRGTVDLPKPPAK